MFCVCSFRANDLASKDPPPAIIKSVIGELGLALAKPQSYFADLRQVGLPSPCQILNIFCRVGSFRAKISAGKCRRVGTLILPGVLV